MPIRVAGGDIAYKALSRRKVGGSRAAMLFAREGAEVELGSSLRRSGVSKKFNAAIPCLSFLRMNTDAEAVVDAADWFVGCTFLNYNSAYLELMLEQILDERDSDRITSLLRSVDIRIDGFRTEAVDGERERQKVMVRHKVGGDTYELRLRDESAGTQKMLGLAGFLLQVLDEGTPLFVDELDAKLHPKLLRFVTLLFKDPEVNKRGAQLVFTPFYYDVMGPYLVPQARSAGFTGVLLGADGVDNTETTIPDGADLSVYNDVMFVNHYATELATSDVSANFVSAYEAKYGETPNNFDALGYDAVYVYKAAMEACGSSDAASVQAALADTSVVYEVSTGTFSFDDTGTPIKTGVLMGYSYTEGDAAVSKVAVKTLSLS